VVVLRRRVLRLLAGLGAISLAAQAPTAFTQMLLPRLEVFRFKSQAYGLVAAPSQGTAVMVFVNGLLMLNGLDYTLVDSTVTFTAQTIGDDPVVQVMYWSAGR
jgi:hypothetical protein